MYDFDGLNTLADITRQQAKARPNEIAHVFEGRETSFAELDTRASRIANGLIAWGCGPQTRIGYLGKNSDMYFELVYGAFKANVVTVGVNWRLAGPEVEYILNDAGCEVLFVGAEFYPLIEKILPACNSVRHVVAMDGGRTDWPGFAEWRDGHPAKDPMLKIADNDDAIQLYTSGTTGHPKGVQLTHANYIAFFKLSSAARWADFDAGDPNLVVMPVFHVAGCNMGLVTTAQGARAIIMKEVDPQAILTLLQQYRIRNAFFVPAVILFLLSQPSIGDIDFSHLKKVFYGASPIAEELLVKAQAVFGCGFTQLYGLTETVGAGTALQPADHEPSRAKLRSCGQLYPGFEARIVDTQGREVKTGEVGEILLKSPTIMKGYWNKPEATAKAIVDGWFHTGDAGYFDEEGFLFIFDRVKDMIVSGGENIYPAEVENAIFGHPAVADVAVIGVPDEKWGEAVKAIVVLKPGMSATEAEIIAYARERIAGYKCPKSVDFIDALPRNPSGKILRRELRAPYWKGRDRGVN